jgi:hypothetical protein
MSVSGAATGFGRIFRQTEKKKVFSSSLQKRRRRVKHNEQKIQKEAHVPSSLFLKRELERLLQLGAHFLQGRRGGRQGRGHGSKAHGSFTVPLEVGMVHSNHMSQPH